MDRELLEKIRNTTTDEEIKQIVDEVIEKCIEELKELGVDLSVAPTIGMDSDINYTKYYKSENDNNDCNYKIQAAWTGFLPKGTKIVYGVVIDQYKDVANRGYYYYLNDNSYLYEFSKFIKDKEIETDEDFILYVYDFLNDYFGNLIQSKDRYILHKLLYKNNDAYFKPTKEHTNKDFVGCGAAMCTEYSSLAENILTLYGFDMMFLMNDKHAYNLIYLNEKMYLLDFSMSISVLDLNGDQIGDLPFLEEIEDFDEDYLKRLVYGREKIILNNYFDLYINDNLYKYVTEDTREYEVWGTREDLIEEDFENERIIKTYKKM